MEKTSLTQEAINQSVREVERDLLYQLNLKFQELRKVMNEYCAGDGDSIYLMIRTVDSGGIRDRSQWWLDWETAEKGIEMLEAEIKKIREETR